RFSRDWSSDVCSSDLFTRAEPLRHAAAGGSVGAVRSAGSAHRSVVHAHERVLRHWFSDLVEPGHGFLPADVSGAAQSAAFRWAADRKSGAEGKSVGAS